MEYDHIEDEDREWARDMCCVERINLRDCGAVPREAAEALGRSIRRGARLESLLLGHTKGADRPPREKDSAAVAVEIGNALPRRGWCGGFSRLRRLELTGHPIGLEGARARDLACAFGF